MVLYRFSSFAWYCAKSQEHPKNHMESSVPRPSQKPYVAESASSPRWQFPMFQVAPSSATRAAIVLTELRKYLERADN